MGDGSCVLVDVCEEEQTSIRGTVGTNMMTEGHIKKSLSPSSTLHIIITQEEEQGSTSKEGGWVAAAEDRFLISFQTQQGRCWSKGSWAQATKITVLLAIFGTFQT